MNMNSLYRCRRHQSAAVVSKPDLLHLSMSDCLQWTYYQPGQWPTYTGNEKREIQIVNVSHISCTWEEAKSWWKGGAANNLNSLFVSISYRLLAYSKKAPLWHQSLTESLQPWWTMMSILVSCRIWTAVKLYCYDALGLGAFLILF